MYEIPVTIITSPMDAKTIYAKLAVQIFWFLILFGLTKITWAVGTKKLVVQGG